MSQSGFSSALSRLRSHSNDQLFVRTSGGMVPTPHGRRMIDTATAALATIENGHAYSICNSVQCRTCGMLFLDIRFSDSELHRL